MISLMTDFGLSDPYVGVMKAAILNRHPAARLVDLTHSIPAFQVHEAGFWLARCWRYFPVGTVHLTVVDPGVGTQRGMVLLETGGQLFVAPDNGLLHAVWHSRAASETCCWRTFNFTDLADLNLPQPSHTFHGRDIFAPLAAELSAGRIAPESIGNLTQPPVQVALYPGTSGQIVSIDHFGNLLTDLDASILNQFSQPALRFRDRQIPLLPTYGMAQPGKLLALVNSWGSLEIVLAQGSAQLLLAAQKGEIVSVVELEFPDKIST